MGDRGHTSESRTNPDDVDGDLTRWPLGARCDESASRREEDSHVDETYERQYTLSGDCGGVGDVRRVNDRVDEGRQQW